MASLNVKLDTYDDTNSVTKNERIFIEKLSETSQFNLDDNVPDLQFAPNSLNIEICSAANPLGFSDHKGYYTTFGAEIELIAKLENAYNVGQEFVNLIYSYRSVSHAIPEISFESPEDAAAEDEAEMKAKRAEINQKIIEILRPEMLKLKDLMIYVTDAIGAFHHCIQHLANREANKEVVPDAIHWSLIKVLDTLVKLDNLKDIKTCLQLDFARYKRVVGANPSIEIMEEQAQLQTFLSNPDPRKSKNYIFTTLRDEVKRISGHENVLLDIIDSTMDQIDNIFYLMPDEKFRLMRVLPYLMLIVDGEVEDRHGFNIFKTNKIKITVLQKLFKKSPVVPLYGDMSMTLELVLAKSGHYDRSSMGASWGRDPDSKTIAQYNLRSHWETIRESYTQFMIRFTASMNRNEKYPFKKVLDEVSIEVSTEVFTMVSEGFQKLAKWTTLVQQMLAWKYTNPCSEQAVAMSQIIAGNEGVQASSVENHKEYAMVLKYNLTKAELSVIVDVISMIKSLAAALAKAESVLAPYIRFHVHHRVQQLVQGDLLPLLHRVDKRNNPILPSLLKIRSIAADWKNGEEPRRDYKTYSRKKGNITIAHPARVVSPAATQLFMLRAQITSLYDTRSDVRRKSSIFAKADLERIDIELFVKFNIDSFYFPYLLNYSNTLRTISDLGDLWYREFYLEMTRSIQFPIELSLPWILTEHLILNTVTNAPMIENVMYVLDIYNDAAHRALYVLNQQYLYDEIEAEVNLVVDQLYFILSEEIYNHYKNLSASSLMEKSLKNKLEELRGTEYVNVEARRFESLMTQKHIQLLGRSVNFSFVLSQNINNKLFRDLDHAIKKFESSDARGIIELKMTLDVISDAHARLSRYLELDSFENMLSEINESYSPATFRGRISLHFLASLIQDIFPNSSYNLFTQRFVSSPIAIRPFEYSKPPKSGGANPAFGSMCSKAYESSCRLVRGFFGHAHIEAFLSLGVGYADLAVLIDQCMKSIYDKLKDLSEYLDALKEGIPPTKFPQYLFQSVGSYGYYEGKLRSILAYDDLKPEVFQLFREIGNCILFLKDLSATLELSHELDFVVLGPLLGLIPNVPGASVDAGYEGDKDDTVSPVVKIVNHLTEELSASEQLRADVVRSNEIVTRIPGVVSRLVDNATRTFDDIATNSTGSSAPSQAVSSKSLFKWVLSQVEEFMYQQNLSDEWAAGHSNPSAARGVCYGFDMENPKGFYRLWSALSFLFCINESDSGDDSKEEKRDNESDEIDEDVVISNEAEFGHGFTVAGTLFIHLLGQRSIFQLSDFSQHVWRVHENETASYAAATNTKSDDMTVNPHLITSAADPSLVKDTKAFLVSHKLQHMLQLEAFAVFEALYPPRKSYLKGTLSRTLFHPPLS